MSTTRSHLRWSLLVGALAPMLAGFGTPAPPSVSVQPETPGSATPFAVATTLTGWRVSHPDDPYRRGDRDATGTFSAALAGEELCGVVAVVDADPEGLAAALVPGRAATGERSPGYALGAPSAAGRHTCVRLRGPDAADLRARPEAWVVRVVNSPFPDGALQGGLRPATSEGALLTAPLRAPSGGTGIGAATITFEGSLLCYEVAAGGVANARAVVVVATEGPTDVVTLLPPSPGGWTGACEDRDFPTDLIARPDAYRVEVRTASGVALAGPLGAPGAWRPLAAPPGPAPTPLDQTFGAVSCVGPTWCLTASSLWTGQTELPPGPAYVWDGTRFTAVPPGLALDVVTLDCVSPTFCAAGGFDALATWDGEAWTPSRLGYWDGTVFGVSCGGRDLCLAVGVGNDNFDGPTGEHHELVWRWDGDRWSELAEGRPTSAVSCPSTVFCMVVGAGARTWDGRSLRDSPGAPDTAHAVACASATHCLVAGTATGLDDDGDRPIHAWDGVRWVARALPAGLGQGTAGRANVRAMECEPVGRCWVLVDTPAGAHLLIDDGAGWVSDTPLPTRNPGSPGAVTCPTPTFCLSVGSINAGDHKALVGARWDGGPWRAVDFVAPRLSQVGQDRPVAVGCAPAAPFCLAVGLSGGYRPATRRPWAATWSPAGWAAAPLPAGDGTGLALFDVSCPTATFCAALAMGGIAGEQGSLWWWDGQWHGYTGAPPSDELITADSRVDCPTPDTCIVLSRYQTHVVDLRGGRHRPVDGLPPPGDLSCVAADRCVVAHGRVSVWDGSAWTVVPDGAGGLRGSSYHTVACTPDDRCALGGEGQVATTHGAGWTEQDIGAEAMSAVACLPDGRCVATGVSRTEPVARSWTLVGNAWRRGPAPPGPLAGTHAPDFAAGQLVPGWSVAFPLRMGDALGCTADRCLVAGWRFDPMTLQRQGAHFAETVPR